MSLQTINELFYEIVERNNDCAMMFKETVVWRRISSREIYRNVVGVARTLQSWGISRGDRIAILGENRPEWAYADFAAMLLGAASVPIYPTLTAEQTAYMLEDSGARVIFVSTPNHMEKVLSIKHRTRVEKVVLMESMGLARDDQRAIPIERLTAAGPNQCDPQFDRNALAIRPDDIATVIYTSGTTGTPKGAMLTQGNLASNLSYSLDFYRFRKGHVSISFLPLSHITARHLDYAMFYRGVTVAYCPYIEELLQALQEVQPTIFVGVPRVYEKIHNNVQGKAASGTKKKLYDWSMRVGERNRESVFAGRRPHDPMWNLADMILFSKVRDALGGKVEIYISGGAPLGKDLLNWYANIGIRIFEGYGLTETSPVIGLNNPKEYRQGSIGKPLSNLQVRIAEDGEILVKGPSVFKGYWNKPAETEAVFEDGWFHTGDIGHQDEDGFLYVTDRKKDLIKTSGGKFIAPQPIELALKANPLVAEAAIIGDKRKFSIALIAPQFPELEKWAAETGLKWESKAQLAANERVRALYRSIVETVNEKLAQFERIKKVLVIHDDITIASGLLTPTMKLKRRVIEERYRQQIEELYSGATEIVGA